MKILNHTGMTVKVVGADGKWIEFQPEEEVPHVHLKRDFIESVGGVQLMEQRFVKIRDLPEPKPGHVFIVSKIVSIYCQERNDLFVVDDIIKSAGNKQVQGCKCLSKLNLCPPQSKQ